MGLGAHFRSSERFVHIPWGRSALLGAASQNPVTLSSCLPQKTKADFFTGLVLI
jgi:hypothetical protein